MPSSAPEIIPVEWPGDGVEPSPATLTALDRAASILRRGGLVAIPTETVYGLAANALDANAVAAIFAAKGRPAGNPLIVHVADTAQARALAATWPPAAALIAATAWPGPVTVVVPRAPCIPDIVTAGGDTVALRCPGHALTRALIARAGVPLAAPSANRSESLSPTTAQHVAASLGGRVELILDAGPCTQGIESTVVDCSVDPPRVLRPGPLCAAQLETLLGMPLAAPGSSDGGPDDIARSPGQARRHYAPDTRLEISDDAATRVAALRGAGLAVGWVRFGADHGPPDTAALVTATLPADPAACAQRLYATLHALDGLGLDRIVVETPPAGAAWAAVRDRLQRAAA